MLSLDKTSLGIELGSTRIKAVLIDENHAPAASGSYDWEHKLENGYWTYSLDDIHNGVRSCFASLAEDVKNKHGEVAALQEKAAEQKAAMEKALRENDDLKTTRANYEAQINQMTEEFVRMNEQITRLEDQLEAAKQAPAAAPVKSHRTAG